MKRAIIEVLPHQRKFAESTNKFVAIVGGFGCGKSFSIPLRCLHLLKRRRGGGKILVLSQSHRMNEDNLIPLFDDLFDAYSIPYEYKKSSKIMSVKLQTANGQILFRSVDNEKRIKGLTVSDFIIDEFDAIPYNKQKLIWREAIARIRKTQRASGAVVTTPEGFKYTYDLFVKGIKDKPPIGEIIRAKTYDNPFLPDDYIQAMESQYDKKVLDQYLNGEFVDINSMPAYYSFSNARNARETYIPRKDFIHIGMDFNVDPMCAVVGEIGPDGKLFIYDEIILKDSNTQIMSSEIKKRYPLSTITVYPDLTGNKRQTSAPLGVTDIRILKGPPYNFRIQGDRISTQRDRLNTVNGAFDHDKVIICRSTCPELLADIRASNRTADGGIDKRNEKPGSPAGHITDAMGYLIQRVFPLSKRSGATIIGR